MAFHKLFVVVALQLTFEACGVHSQISFPSSCSSPVPSCKSGIQTVSQFVIPAVIKPLIQPEYAPAPVVPAVPEYGYPGPYGGGMPIVLDDDDDFNHHWLYWLILLLSRRGGFGGWGNGGYNGGCGCGCGCGGGCYNNCNGGYNGGYNGGCNNYGGGCNNCGGGCNGGCRNCYGNGNCNNGPTNFLPFPFPCPLPPLPGYPPFDPYTEGSSSPSEVSLIIKTDPPQPPA